MSLGSATDELYELQKAYRSSEHELLQHYGDGIRYALEQIMGTKFLEEKDA